MLPFTLLAFCQIDSQRFMVLPMYEGQVRCGWGYEFVGLVVAINIPSRNLTWYLHFCIYIDASGGD